MAKVSDVRIEALRLQHELEALRDRPVILDDEYAHLAPRFNRKQSLSARGEGSVTL